MGRTTHRLVVDGCLNSGELLICVECTDKTMRIKLLKNTLRFSPGHLDMMFGKSNRVSIPIGGKSPHKLLVWCDGDITIYPYRAGVPYLFKKSPKEVATTTDREKLEKRLLQGEESTKGNTDGER